MTWVTVVKFWAYQAHQLQLIVYTNLPLTIPGLELFSLVSKQWGLAVITNRVEKVTLPLTSTMLIGIAGDGGNGNNSAGFNSSLYIYTTATVYPTGIAFIAICK